MLLNNKLKSLLVFTYLFLFSYISYGQEWITKELEEFISIDFPSEPECLSSGNFMNTCILSTQLSGSLHISIQDFSSRTDELLQYGEDLNAFYDGFLNEQFEYFENKSQAKSIIKVSDTIINIRGLEGREYRYIQKQEKSNLSFISIERIFLINEKVISIKYNGLEGSSEIETEIKGRFFNSFRVSGTYNQNLPAHFQNYRAGTYLNYLLKFLIFVLLIYIIYSIFYKKINKKALQS